MNLQQQLEQERLEHNAIYAAQQAWLLEEALTWERYYTQMCLPPHQGGTRYGLDHKIYFDYLLETLKKTNSKNIHILDYGCGTGALGIALATLGYRVSGFDLSDTGIEIAQKAAQKAGVTSQTDFRVADVQHLPFLDAEFDLVVGKAVLHHTIKYKGTDQELRRVMKPRAKALFLEGAASNPLIALARTFTIQEELGDVPLTIPKLQAYSKDFSTLHIKGYFFLYMLKRLGYYSSDENLPDKGQNRIGRNGLFRFFLRLCLAFDRLFINEKATRLAGRYLIEIQK